MITQCQTLLKNFSADILIRRHVAQNKVVQKQIEILMNNEEKLTAALSDKNKKLFLDFANACSVVNGESTLDSFIMAFG